MNGIRAILSDHRKAYARRKYQQKRLTSRNNVNQPQSLSNSSEDMNQPIIKPVSSMQSSHSNKSISTPSSQASPEMILRTQASTRMSKIESAERSYEDSSIIAFKNAARSIDNGQKNMNSYLSSEISKIKSRPSNAPKWNAAIKNYRQYLQNVISIRTVEDLETRRVKTIMLKFHKDLARQYSYWYYQNAPEILTAQFKGYNRQGIPKFAIDKKDTSWFHNLVHPIIKRFQQNQQWIVQKWRSGKHVIRNWMKAHYIPYDVQSRNKNNIDGVRNITLSDIKDKSNQKIIHRLIHPISKRTHSIIKRTDRRIQTYHDEAYSLFNLMPQITSYKSNVIRFKAFSASSASASYSNLVSGQIEYYTSMKNDNMNINNINSLRVSARKSIDEDYSANVASLNLRSPAIKNILGTDISHVSNAASATDAIDKYLRQHPKTKKYAKGLGITGNRSELTKISRHQRKQRSARTNREGLNKSRRIVINRIRKHQRERTYRNHSHHNNHSFER